MSPNVVVLLLLLLLFTNSCFSWDNEELEMFDLVEEINQNFYELMGIEQTAKSSEIRKAYRRLSLQLHPDKNNAEDAEEKFRQMVAVYEVLKDETRRQQYDNVLENGLPDWRMPVYYYRRVRKMGLIELSLLLFFILTIGHYLVIWSVYLEKRFTMEELFSEVRKKKEKKARKNKVDVGEEMDELFKEELEQLPRPELRNLLPFQCVRLVIHLIVSTPAYCSAVKNYILEAKDRWREKKEETEDEEEDTTDVVKKPKKRKKVELPTYSPEMYENTNVVRYSPIEDIKQEDSQQIIKTGDWTDEEVGLLAKAVAKYPGGTAGRWDKVAEMVGRTPTEVIKKSKSFKGSYLLNVNPKAQGLTGTADEQITLKGGKSISDDIISTNHLEYIQQNDSHSDLNSSNSASVKTKIIINQSQKAADINQSGKSSKVSQSEKSSSKNQSEKSSQINQSDSSSQLNQSQSRNNVNVDNDTWTQNQQMIFEWALKQYPKGTEQRWDRIAEHIPGKSKEDCMGRFKYLAEIVRKRKGVAN